MKPTKYTLTEKYFFHIKNEKNTSYFMHIKKTVLYISQIEIKSNFQ